MCYICCLDILSSIWSICIFICISILVMPEIHWNNLLGSTVTALLKVASHSLTFLSILVNTCPEWTIKTVSSCCYEQWHWTRTLILHYTELNVVWISFLPIFIFPFSKPRSPLLPSIFRNLSKLLLWMVWLLCVCWEHDLHCAIFYLAMEWEQFSQTHSYSGTFCHKYSWLLYIVCCICFLWSPIWN